MGWHLRKYFQVCQLGKDSLIAICCMVITNTISIYITYYSGKNNLDNLIVQVESYKENALRQNKIFLYSNMYNAIQSFSLFDLLYIKDDEHESLKKIIDNINLNCNSLYSICNKEERMLIDSIKSDIIPIIRNCVYKKNTIIVLKNNDIKTNKDYIKRIKEERLIVSSAKEAYLFLKEKNEKIQNELNLLGKHIMGD